MQFIRKRKWRLLIIGFVLVLIVIFRSFLYGNFVHPIALFLWAAWRVLASVHQNVYWTLLLAGGFLPLIWMIFSAKGATARSAYRQDPLPPGRVEHWERLLAVAHGSRKDQERLRAEWDKLLQSVVAQAGRSNMNDYPGDDAGGIEYSPESTLLIARNTSEHGRVPWVQKCTRWLPPSIRQHLRPMIKINDQWIRDSLGRMESELDIPYDG
jgi:hypothetical protein